MNKIIKIKQKQTISRDGKTVYHTIEWGRMPGERKSTGLFSYIKPKTIEEKTHNDDIKAKLREETIKKDAEINSRFGLHSHDTRKSNSNFLVFFKSFAEREGERRQTLYCYLVFKKFINKEHIKANEITPELAEKFRDYLYKNHSGVTPGLYFLGFKAACKKATSEKYFQFNPASEVKTKFHPSKKKDIIDPDEWLALLNTPCLNTEVKKAAIFSLYTALRWVDVAKLDWQNVRKQSIIVNQQKTKVEIEIPLHEVAMQMIGERKTKGKVFNLGSRDVANRILRDWTKAAGITKKISWHGLRHSVSVILQDNGSAVQTVAGILGHTSTMQVSSRYKRYSQKQAIIAINSLPSLNNKAEEVKQIASDVDKQIELERLKSENMKLEIELLKLKSSYTPLKAVK